jgi:hypothetical protein
MFLDVKIKLSNTHLRQWIRSHFHSSDFVCKYRKQDTLSQGVVSVLPAVLAKMRKSIPVLSLKYHRKKTDCNIDMNFLLYNKSHIILSCATVTVDGVWIGNWI